MMDNNLNGAKSQCPITRLNTGQTETDKKGGDQDGEEMIVELEDVAAESVDLEESDGNDDENYDDDAIHSLLEDGIKNIGAGPKTFTKIVMKQVNDIDLHILPEDWVEVSHHSGIPVYLDRKKRVISVSRPYHLGSGSVRRHAIPQSAIPCLNYRRGLLKNGRSLTYDASCVTEDIRIKNNLFEEEIVERSPSMSDLLRLPKRPIKSGSDDVPGDNKLKPEVEQESAKVNIKNAEAVVKSACDSQQGVSDEAKIDIDADVEEGEILSETEDTTETEKDVSKKKRSFDKTIAPNSSETKIDADTNQSSKKARIDEQGGESKQINQFANVETSVISIQDTEREMLLEPSDVQQYCKRLFEFEEERKVHFKTMRNKYKFFRAMRKITREKPATMMPENANLIRYKIPLPADAPPTAKPREFVINPTGKSYICILHEYCQMAVRRPPTYQFKELDNSPTPYSVTVDVNGTVYGEGFGDSKKRAKLDAAKITLEMLIPGVSKIISQMEEQAAAVSESGTSGTNQHGTASAAKAAGLVTGQVKVAGATRGWNTCSSHDMELFDAISITDRRLQEISMRMALPGPYAILCEYLRRQCISEQNIKMEMIPKGNQKNQFTMTVKEETVTVFSKSKREGRHLAAQALLQRFHPHISCWSGILKLYGPGSKPDRKMDQEVITELQSREKGTVKNYLIDLLKSQMKSLAEEWDESGELHKGKFYIAPSQLPFIDFHPDSLTETQVD